jgi:hypothetical protein
MEPGPLKNVTEAMNNSGLTLEVVEVCCKDGSLASGSVKHP